MKIRIKQLNQLWFKGHVDLVFSEDGSEFQVFPSSGSFVLQVEGLTGEIHNLDFLKELCAMALKQLGQGWNHLKISERKQLLTAFGQPDEVCDLVIEGYGPKDKVPESMKFDLGIKLKDGRVEIYGISRSIPRYSVSFMERADLFKDRLVASAKIHQTVKALGIRPQAINYAQNKTLVKIRVM